MEDPIREYVIMTTEILLVSILLVVIILFSTMSKQVTNTLDGDKVAQIALEEYKEVSMYDNKVVNGADVVDAVLKHSRYYTFLIVVGQPSDINTLDDKEQLIQSITDAEINQAGITNGQSGTYSGGIWNSAYVLSIAVEQGIVKTNESTGANIKDAQTKGSYIWTQDYLVNTVIKDDIQDLYRANIIRDNYGSIKGIQFIKE